MVPMSIARGAQRFARAGSLLLASALFVAAVHPSQAAAQDAQEDPADTFFREGAEAVQADKIQLAYEKFRAAWNLRQTFEIAANLGVVEKALGKRKDAAFHLEFALRHYPAVSGPEKKKQIEVELDELKKQVGEIRLTVPSGSEIEVNGEKVGTAPLQGTLFVEPGQVTIVAKKEGVGKGRAEVTVGVGEGKDVRIELIPDKTVGPVETPTEPPPMWLGFVIGGVGVGAAGAGVALLVVGQGKLSDAEELGAPLIDDREDPEAEHVDCDAGSPPQICQDIQKNLDDAGTFTTAGIALAAVGGAALVTGIVLIALPRDEKSDEKAPAPVAIAPWISPEIQGIFVGGRF